MQEEPVNVGPASHVSLGMTRLVGADIRVIAREESASPATGSLKVHQHEHALLLDEAFSGLK
ncbi:MAG: hypothetical protein LC663_03535 [Actinobacteria bacterium]|nr:hypothetical protein [Actinomycetota bacterium]